MRLGSAETLEYLVGFEFFIAGTLARQRLGDHICLAKFDATPNGSPEELVDAGVEEGAKVTGAWAAQLVAALKPATTEAQILSVLERFEAGFRLEDFAAVAEDKFLRGALLGGLDSQWERENEQVLEPVKFGLGVPSATATGGTFQDALKMWEKRKVMPKAAYDALKEGARRKAFTVARMASSELLDVTHAELQKQIKRGLQGGQTEGLALADFHKFAEKRLESAGWTPASASHVETIFRTNVISAYSSGRFNEMRQPAVLAALPYWQIQVVKDPRTRETHRAADGVVLPATDPFWKHAYPPFGYNCRCKVCARTAAWLKRNSKSVGPRPKDLPDPGFDSGTQYLVQVPTAALKPAEPTEPQALPPPKPQAPGLGAPSPFPAAPPPQTAPNFLPVLEPPLPEKPLPGLGAPSPFVEYAPPTPFVPKLPIAEVERPVPVPRPEPPPSLKPRSPFPEQAPLNPIAKQIAHQAGSNPGGIFEGTDGVKRYVKFYKDPAQAVGEHLANSLYSDLGFGGVKSMTFQHGGALAYASELLPNTRTLSEALAQATPAQAKKLAKKALEGFAVDVLSANWDAAGLNLDNMLVDAAGNITRIDNGAAFLTRAQGARKPAHLLADSITEWDSFFDPNKNPAYAKLAAKAGVKSPADLAASIKKSVANINKLAEAPGGWAKYVADRADGMSLEDKQAMVEMLEARTEFLNKKLPTLAKPKKPKKVKLQPGMPIEDSEINSAKAKYRGLSDRFVGWISSHDHEDNALRRYTGSAYSDLNKVLRGEKDYAGRPLQFTDDQLALARNIQAALVRAKAEGLALDGVVWRGMRASPEVLKGLLSNELVDFHAFTSTTVSRSVADNFAGGSSGSETPVVFRIRQRSAVPIRSISRVPHENEALLPSGKRFRILNRSRDGSTHLIDLEELN